MSGNGKMKKVNPTGDQPQKCNVIPGSAACKKRQKRHGGNGSMLCKYCTAVKKQ